MCRCVPSFWPPMLWHPILSYPWLWNTKPFQLNTRNKMAAPVWLCVTLRDTILQSLALLSISFIQTLFKNTVHYLSEKPCVCFTKKSFLRNLRNAEEFKYSLWAKYSVSWALRHVVSVVTTTLQMIFVGRSAVKWYEREPVSNIRDKAEVYQRGTDQTRRVAESQAEVPKTSKSTRSPQERDKAPWATGSGSVSDVCFYCCCCDTCQPQPDLCPLIVATLCCYWHRYQHSCSSLTCKTKHHKVEILDVTREGKGKSSLSNLAPLQNKRWGFVSIFHILRNGRSGARIPVWAKIFPSPKSLERIWGSRTSRSKNACAFCRG